MNEIVQRLREIMEDEGINQKTFAEQAGVKPATLSHAMTGRNNPSTELLKAIHHAFPHYRLPWIMSGELPKVEPEYRGAQVQSQQSTIFAPHELPPASTPVVATEYTPSYKRTEPTSARVERAQRPSTSVRVEAIQPQWRETKKIEKIIVYYDDSTFQTFVPAD